MRAFVVLAALLAAVPAAAQHQHGQGHQHGQAGEHAHHPAGVLPAGWEARLDRPGPMDNVRFMEMEGHQHAILGPSAIFYRPADVADGEYRLSGTFRQNRLTRHPEAYGLILGGRDLQGEGQDYLYFLVRQDGKFLVKHRAGSETHTLMDWTEHEAVRRPGEDGRATNTLAVDVAAAGVRFLVNGTEVGALQRVPMLNTDGVYGLRINHGLDVRVDGFGIER
jgi:hypothetical protein